MKTIQCLCAVGLSGLLAGSTATAAEPAAVWTATLSDFDTPADIVKWQLVGDQDVEFCRIKGSPPPAFEPSAEHATSGTQSVRFGCQAVTGTFPTVMLTGSDIPVQDWGPFDYLVVDVFNPLEFPASLHVLATEEGVRDDAIVWSQGPDAPLWDTSREVVVAPGRQTLRLRLDDIARSRRVTVFRFVYVDPLQAYTLFLDSLRLETAPISETRIRLEGKLAAVERRIAGTGADALGPELAKLRDRVLALAGEGAELSPAGRSIQDYVPWRNRAASIADALRDLEERVPIAAFNRTVKPYEWGYGWADGATKVYRTGIPFAGELGGTVRLELAANEGEGVQVVLRSRNAVRKNVRVTVSDLTNEQGNTIAASQVEVLPVGYVNTKKPYYPVPFVGWHPDPLLNFLTSFILDEEVWQPVWLDVRSRPDQKPGLYTGRITASADDLQPLSIPFEVRVWSLAVPHEQHFATAVSLMDQVMYRPYGANVPEEEWRKYMAYCRGEKEVADLGQGEALRLQQIRSKFRQMVFDHRIAPQAVYHYYPTRLDDARQVLASGASRFLICNLNGPIHDVSGREVDATRYWKDEATGMVSEEGKQFVFDRLDQYLPLLEEAGIADKGYLYGCDEYVTKRLPGMLDLLRAIRTRYPKLPIATTALDNTYGLQTGLGDLVDIWVPLLPKYELDPKRIADAKARGKEVWWYTCLNPKRPWPNHWIEYPAAENRLITGFMPFKYRVDGFLYYSIYSGSTGRYSTDASGRRGRSKVPFGYLNERMTKGPLTDFDGNTEGVYSGDGQMMYPGEDGPVPTIRLKSTRDGLEDYEYLWMLRQRLEDAKSGRTALSEDWQARATALLEVPPSVVRSLTEFTQDGPTLLAARRQIAALLEQAQAAPAP